MSCFGLRKSRSGDTEPLLPQYEHDTSMQRAIHQKLHTYQMVRALSKGYMPSTEQIIVNLRTLLASDILDPNNPSLSDTGRLLLKFIRQWLTYFIELLRHKNSTDQVQNFIWFLSRSRISLDTNDLANAAASAKTKADASAAYESLRTVGSLLLTNSDIRLFLSDLTVIGRQVFADTAFAVSSTTREAAEQIRPSDQDTRAVKSPVPGAGMAPSIGELGGKASEVSGVVANGIAKTGQEAAASLEDNLSGEQEDALLLRLKMAVTKLRGRNDYLDSVSTISSLLRRYAKVYSRAADGTISAIQEGLESNPELDRAVESFWSFLSSFGARKQWEELENKLKLLMAQSQKDPEFENLMTDIGNSLQKLLTDPSFSESVQNKIEELRRRYQESGKESSLRKDVDNLLLQLQETFQSIAGDEDVSKLLSTSLKISQALSPTNIATRPELVRDFLQAFLPLCIQAIQYIPIPRLEVSVQEVDILLENLILEPGRTANGSSFFPFRLRIETYNDLEIRKARFKTVSKVTSLVSIKIDGMSIRADDVGFWLRAHLRLLRLADEGIVSFQLDERGIDVHIDVEIGKNRLEKILTLRDVRVKIHKLSYKLRKSKFACLAWCLKPFIQPLLRKVLEYQLAIRITNGIHAANRELLFARERLRATQISNPNDLGTFVKAVISRLAPEEDPDLYSSVRVTSPGGGVFAGVYAPGSIVKLWNDEAVRAGEVVEENAAEAWRNGIFDARALMMG
ncbi:hypothetical protein FGG08_004062 [Glutinoglossum americanum]|uniref:HAM1-like N-terminal domain-containing protein n=1 Tax=Glutinoglossum americanum TaxID=1670608 RepID=A0A9P8I172_9PEZI|nr:hypothetical protein FGG08_004062 [Glutinoglossum americanum]